MAQIKREQTLPAECLSFIHLGDIHFPELMNAHSLADHKDKGISNELAGRIGSTRLAEISRGMEEIRKNELRLVAIISTGDLTTKGDLAGYRDCLNFLGGALNLSDDKYWENRRFFVVPGNHDIDRSTIVPGQDIQNKFLPLLEQWQSIFGIKNHLFFGPPSPTDLGTPIDGVKPPSLRFLPLNTCFLCGEHRSIPKQIRTKVLDLIGELKSTIAADAFEAMMREQIDCPAVSRSHAYDLERYIAKNDADSISVVFGHHPLLAQPTPRIEGYSEMLNAGYVREAVLEARRNVIYLHGHIHQDPILLVNSPLRGSHRIINISAPALEDGFNLVRVHFSRVSGLPIALELVPYRFGDHLGLIKGISVKIRLVQQEELWNEIDNPWVKFLLDHLSSPTHIFRFRDLTKITPIELSFGLNEKDISDNITRALLLLELLELVIIANREKSIQLWQCRRRSI